METGKDLRDLSIPELLKKLSEEVATLVRAELALARAEIAEQGKKAGVGVGFLGASTLFALGAFGALTATLILALSLVLAPWLAALIVTVVYGAVAGIAALVGKQRLTAAVPPAPQTMQTLKEDVEWAKTQARSVRK